MFLAVIRVGAIFQVIFSCRVNVLDEFKLVVLVHSERAPNFRVQVLHN